MLRRGAQEKGRHRAPYELTFVLAPVGGAGDGEED
jgi:hypothetical protein